MCVCVHTFNPCIEFTLFKYIFGSVYRVLNQAIRFKQKVTPQCISKGRDSNMPFRTKNALFVVFFFPFCKERYVERRKQVREKERRKKRRKEKERKK